MSDTAHFFGLIDRYNSSGADQRFEIEQEIQDAFAAERAVVAMDMSGYTKTVRAHGIVHYLAMIRRMQVVAGQEMERTGGTMFKAEADNLSGTFNSTGEAVRGAISIMRAIAKNNEQFDPSRQIRLAIGIAYGDVLCIPGYDAKGYAVNIAHKLGEDFAEAGEILVDASRPSPTRKIAIDMGCQVKEVRYQISGSSISADRILFEV